jgi:hypothetical protein
MVRNLVTCAVATVIALNSGAAAAASGPRLPDGTRIAVRVAEQISSASVKDNDPITLAVVEDVMVDGQVVIKQGTPVRGVIIDAEAKRRMGRAGKLHYSITETKAVDRSVIRLRAVQERKGDSNVTSTAVTTTAVAVFVPVAAPLFLLRKGHDVVIPEGTRIDAFVDGDHSIAGLAAATPQPAPVQAKSSASNLLSNADVLALHEAGFSESIILAKINASPCAFALEATDLLTLKRAGLSERVIAAMIAR